MSSDQQEFSPEEYDRHAEAKVAAIERILGPMHDSFSCVSDEPDMESLVDICFFREGIAGTGLATMQLIAPDGSGSLPNALGTYELVAFTRLELCDASSESCDDPFTRITNRFHYIFTLLSMYAEKHEALIPGETFEIPAVENFSRSCIIFDEYAPNGVAFEIDGRRHSLLLCMEVFRKEMHYAIEYGGAALINKLKQAGHYPYSDLDREPVVPALRGA